MENLIAASACLAALLVDNDDPTAVETRRIRELVQTALAQQEIILIAGTGFIQLLRLG